MAGFWICPVNVLQGFKQVLSILGLRVWQGYKYGRVAHVVEQAWISLNMLKCVHIREYALLALSMIEYVGIYLKKQTAEYPRILNSVWCSA